LLALGASLFWLFWTAGLGCLAWLRASWLLSLPWLLLFFKSF
jgi:hypothetical protein